MVSPAKCESEEPTAQLNLHSSSRSDTECLSLVLLLPKSTGSEDPEEAAQLSSREATNLSNGEMVRRRSTRLSCNSPNEIGGEGILPQRKSSRGKPQQLMLTNGSQLRRSPRSTPVDGKIDNVYSVPVPGKFGSKKRKSSSALIEKEGLESQGMTFKDIAAIAKSLEVEIMSECQEINNDAMQVPAKRKVDNDTLSLSINQSIQSLVSNKPVRRTPRFMKGTENEEEVNLDKSKEKGKSLASGNPFRTSPMLSGIVENGQTETSNIIKDCGPVVCGAKQVREAEKLAQSVNGYRTKTLGKPDRNAADIHTISVEISQNGMSNELTMTTAIVEHELMESSPQVKASDCSDIDKGITVEIHANSSVIYKSDSNELPAKKIKSSLYTEISDEKCLEQAASGYTLSSVENVKLTSLDLNSPTKSTNGKGERVTRTRTTVHEQDKCSVCFFIGEPISCEEAQQRWRWRYDLKERKYKSRGQQSEDDEDKIVANVECHYSQAKIEGHTFSLGDFAYIKGEEKENHVGKIVEFFKTTDGESYFRVQWFYRATDTVMKQEATHHEKRRLFYSTVMNDNPIDCLVSKVTVLQVSPKAGQKPNSIKSDYYFDMEYCVEYTTFKTLKSTEDKLECCGDMVPTESTESVLENKIFCGELPVLDLYSGCGGMSTGLSLGAKIPGVDVVTVLALSN